MCIRDRGDVVVFQLPNWVEAGITFWATAYLGAVIVPIVHFYGAKEVDYIVRATEPDVVVTAEQFGRNDYLGVYRELLADRPDLLWLVVGDSDETSLPGRAVRFASVLDHPPVESPTPVDVDSPALVLSLIHI